MMRLQFLGESLQDMRRARTSWLTLILMLVALAIPITSRADWYSRTGGSDGGDPDYPTPGGGITPGWRARGTGRGDDQINRPMSPDSWWMRRYLTLLSGLRSYNLRF